ncbi:hypothetical protein RB595_002307 [Gaeumannomyces hyphopodioides]
MSSGVYQAFVQHYETFIKEHGCYGRRGLNADDATERLPFVPLIALTAFWTEQRLLGCLPDKSASTDDLGVYFNHPIVRKEYLKVFSILVDIGQPKNIVHFTNAEVRDADLPLDNLPSDWEDDDDISPWIGDFKKHQWKFCPHTLGASPLFKRNLDARLILPFTGMERLSRETDAQDPQEVKVYKVKWHHLCCESKKTVFALKVYVLGNPELAPLWNNEIKTYCGLGGPGAFEYIVQCYGIFQSLGMGCIVLEYANGGSLLQLFENPGLPRLEDRRHFWGQLFDLTKGLEALQNSSSGSDTGRIGEYALRADHQDIKPDNILAFHVDAESPYSARLKLSDFGNSQIERTVKGGFNVPAKNTMGCGTYAAPENCKRGKDFHWAWDRSDVWSLGCVASQALVWSIRGPKALEEYDNRRFEEGKKNCFGNGFYPGAFHNGHIPHPLIEKEHNKALEEVDDKDDKITRGVHRIILDRMLVGDPADRSTPKRVYDAWVALLAEVDDAPAESPTPHKKRRPEVPTINTAPDLMYPQSYENGRHSDEGQPVTSLSNRSSLSPNLDTPRQRSRDSSYRDPDRARRDGGSQRRPPRPPMVPSSARSSTLSPWEQPVHEPIGHRPSSPYTPRLSSSTASPSTDSDVGSAAAREVEEKNMARALCGSQRGASPVLQQHLAIPVRADPWSGRRSSPSTIGSTTQGPPSSEPQVTVDDVYFECIEDRPRKLSRMLGMGRRSNPVRRWPELADVLRRVQDRKGREQIFIVDDSPSMREHRKWVQVTLCALVDCLKRGGVDANGKIDLYYTSDGGGGGSSSACKGRNTSDFMRSIKNRDFGGDNNARDYDVAGTLTRALEKALEVLDRAPCSIYVLTNGHWGSPAKEAGMCGVDEVVQRAMGCVGASRYISNRNAIGIQFVHFFRPDSPLSEMDEVGRLRLSHLDNHMAMLSDDIVDTRRWNDPIANILLGSINKGHDINNDGDQIDSAASCPFCRLDQAGL